MLIRTSLKYLSQRVTKPPNHFFQLTTNVYGYLVVLLVGSGSNLDILVCNIWILHTVLKMHGDCPLLGGTWQLNFAITWTGGSFFAVKIQIFVSEFGITCDEVQFTQVSAKIVTFFCNNWHLFQPCRKICIKGQTQDIFLSFFNIAMRYFFFFSNTYLGGWDLKSVCKIWSGFYWYSILPQHICIVLSASWLVEFDIRWDLI